MLARTTGAEGPIGPVGHCHCPTCRKAHGAAFSTVGRVRRAGFEWTSGELLLSSYESSPGKDRFFCSRCGSQLVAAWRDEDEVILRVGCIDTEEIVEPVAHVWTEKKAAWFNHRRLFGPIGDIPPVEFEQLYYERQGGPTMGVGLN